MEDPRLDFPQLLERLHRRYLDIVRLELDRLGVRELTPVQAVLLANVGESEMVMRELIERGYYQGSNVSYNMKKLVEFGYIEQERATHDKRAVRVKVTGKGKEICDRVRAIQALEPRMLKDAGIGKAELDQTRDTLRRLERAWSDFVRYG